MAEDGWELARTRLSRTGGSVTTVLPDEPTQNRAIADDEVLTQHGKKGKPYQNTLRDLKHPPRREKALSMILGDADVEEATDIRFGGIRSHYEQYAVRHTTAGALRKAGFKVVHTGNYPGNPYHVSVYPRGPWGSDEALSFDGCFQEEEASPHE